MWDYINRNADAIEISAFFFVLTVIVAYIIFRSQKTVKSLDYAVIAHQILTTGMTSAESKLRFIWSEMGPISFDVSRPAISQILIANTGRQEITQADLLEPIVVEPDQSGPRNPNQKAEPKILEVVVVRVSEPGIHPLGAVRKSSDESVELTPKALNPGDWMVLQVTMSAAYSKEPPRLKVWIAGQTRPMLRDQSLLDPSIRQVLSSSTRALLKRLPMNVVIAVAGTVLLVAVALGLVALLIVGLVHLFS